MINREQKRLCCTYCGRDFKSLTKQIYCNSCLKRYLKQSFPRSSTQKRMIRNRIFITLYKKNKKCKMCGYSKYPEIMDFHHKNSRAKEKSVSELMRTLQPIDKIKREIEKCVLLCPNCHREVHLKEKWKAIK